MRGFIAFARKEVVEILRTWRIWVLPGILLFFALTGPAMARYTPEIVAAVAGSQLAGFTLPTPVYQDAYAQWIKSLSQIGLFAVIIIYGGIVSSERRSGTAALVLTKPVSRAGFVVAKTLVQALFLAVVVMAGAAITWGGTALFFGIAPSRPLFAATGTWLAFGFLFVTVMTLLSVMVSSQAGAAGIGLGIYVLVSIAGLWKPLGMYSPAALVGGPATLASGRAFDAGWPIATTLMLAAALIALAALSFNRKEL